MRNWILKIHLYGALLCSSYFVIFGVTSINFNHKFEFLKPTEAVVTWESLLSIENIADNETLANTVRDRLGLMGWLPPWRWSWDAQQNFTFWIHRPAKQYQVTVLAEQHRVRVAEHRTGFWSVIQALHALRELPNSKIVSVWGAYLELATWMALLASVSGIWLWISSRREKAAALVSLAASVSISAAFMWYVYLQG